MRTDPVQNIITRLNAVKQTGKDQWQARCPAHEDDIASLSIGRGQDGRVLIHCHAGCERRAILQKLDLTDADLFADHHVNNPTRIPPGPQKLPACSTVYSSPDSAAAALSKQLGGTLAGSWIYHDADGRENFRVLRFDLPGGKKTFRPIHFNHNRWASGDPDGLLPLYKLPEIIQASRVYLCEGEKCVDAAWSIGLIATTSSHGAGSAKKSDWSILAGKEVVILPDNDAAGSKYAAEVAEICKNLSPQAKVCEVKLPGLTDGGDIVDFIEANDCRTAQELKGWIEGLAEDASAGQGQLPIIPIRKLLAENPHLREPVIHGLLREGETMNLIASPKTGKSWLAIDLAIAVASGQLWLGLFQTCQGDVLVIDNELHPQTIAHRVPKVGIARGLSTEAYADRVFVNSMRGRLRNIHAMAEQFESIEPGRFKLIIIDALYRALPREVDENSNAEMAQIYNSIDRYADRLGCCFVLIHHSSKGNQSQKSVTDTGAGAGSQSRAADAHVVLRPHEEEGSIVFEAAVRSWPPVEPICMRWDFPVWHPASDLDPAALRRDRPRRSKNQEEESEKPSKTLWNAETFTTAFIDGQPRPRTAILEQAILGGLSERRATILLDLAIDQGLVHANRLAGWGNKIRYSTLKTTPEDEK